MWQGSSESNMTKGKILVDWMNQLDFTAMAIGNHEFDWGEEYIASNAAFAEFPFIAINIYDRATNQLVDYCSPSVMVDRDGLQIGIIGAIGDCYSSIAVDKCDDVYFKVGRDLTNLVKNEADRLRREGADFIVYLIHDGYGNSSSGSLSSSQMSSYYDA
jgi:2',3'-cyclic-nucleotide 2'-phosphodiesterase/3'-nucleotidase